MAELGQRMLEPGREPDDGSVVRWLGAANHKRWMRLLQFIENNYEKGKRRRCGDCRDSGHIGYRW